jgi:hypothetical protein
MDYYYGASYDMGVSSMLMWALGAAPSKDTLWTTPNSEFAVEKKGCDSTGCPADHSAAGCELHTMLALMTTGPVGFSDFKGQTNKTLLMRTCSSDGTLLKPSKPVTTVDGALQRSMAHTGFVFGSYSGSESGAHHSNTWCHYFMGFKLQSSYDVRATDFWPALAAGAPGHPLQYVYRFDQGGLSCGNGTAASGCGVEALDPSAEVLLTLPASAEAGSAGEYAPALVAVFPICASGFALLGELEKFASLSAYPSGRFSGVSCTEQGLGFTAHGSAGEVVTVTAMVPSSAGAAAAEALALQLTIPGAGVLSVSLP